MTVEGMCEPPVPPEDAHPGPQASQGAGSHKAKAAGPRTYQTATLIKMMRQVLSRRIALMQEQPMADGVKEVTLLNSAQRALSRLIEMDNGRKATGRSKAAAAEMAELRRKIAARIEQLNQG